MDSILLKDYAPKSSIVARETSIPKARTPRSATVSLLITPGRYLLPATYPRAAARFLAAYRPRVLFGTDMGVRKVCIRLGGACSRGR